MPRIDVHCDEELYRRVRDRARLEGRSMSNLVRRALHFYLDGLLVNHWRFPPEPQEAAVLKVTGPWNGTENAQADG